MAIDLFVDGGCIGKNPSPHGGTWAWVLVDDPTINGGLLIRAGCGYIEPKTMKMQTISNNVAELMAAVRGLQATLARDPEWNGTIWTDSMVTLWRITDAKGFKNVPDNLRLKTLDLRQNRKWKARLLAGHPTRAELEMGRSYRRPGLPVSGWNAFCDKKCRDLARKFLQEK